MAQSRGPVPYPVAPYDPRMNKPHAMRVLDAHKIPYTAKERFEQGKPFELPVSLDMQSLRSA